MQSGGGSAVEELPMRVARWLEAQGGDTMLADVLPDCLAHASVVLVYATLY